MAGINFLSRNLVASADISLETGTENAQFPLNNILNDSTSIKFRSLEDNVVILLDLKQTTNIDVVAIHGDTNEDLNLTSASIKTSLTTDFSSSDTVEINLSDLERSGYAFFDDTSARFVELTLVGGGEYAELSNLFIGKRVNLPQQNLSISGFVYGKIDQSSVSTNEYGQVFVDKRNQIKTLSGPLQHCLKSEQDVLDEVFTRHGQSVPLWVIVDPDSSGMVDGRDKLSCYGYLTDVPQWSAGGGQTWNTELTIRQAG